MWYYLIVEIPKYHKCKQDKSKISKKISKNNQINEEKRRWIKFRNNLTI